MEQRKGPKRIVCLTEETTELLYLLGEEERVVGISAYTVRPSEARQKPVVSAFIQGSIPKIRALEPDLVIGFSDIQADLARDLIREGLNVLVLNQRSISEIFESMDLVGRLVGRGSETRALLSSFERKLEAVQSKKRDSSPRVFFQEWEDPIICGIRWVSELIEVAGGVDVFSEKRACSLAKDRIVTAKEVAAREPDVLVGSWCGKPLDFSWVYAHPEWQNTEFVRRRRVHEIDSSIILQPGPALFLAGLDALENAIHRNSQSGS